MREKILTAINILLVFVPWTILPLRTNAWALETPAAQIIIASYAIFMIGGGIFSLLSYKRKEMKNSLIKICLVIHMLYLAGGVTALFMMLPGLIS